MILVTGTSGFIGGNILRAFGSQAVGVQRQAAGQNTIAFNLVETDSVNTLITHFQDHGTPDCVIHAAATTPWSQEPNFHQDIQMAATITTLCNQLKVPKLILLSGWNVYAKDAVVPYTEQTTIHPETAYGQSKKAVEEYVTQNLQDTVPVILRLASVYGPGQVSPGLLTNLVHAAFTNGRLTLGSEYTRRDYVYISDLIEVIKFLSQRDFRTKQIFNVGSGASLSVKEAADIISKICSEDYGVQVDVSVASNAQDTAPSDNRLDITKLQSQGILGDPTPFETGIKTYIEWTQHENIL